MSRTPAARSHSFSGSMVKVVRTRSVAGARVNEDKNRFDSWISILLLERLIYEGFLCTVWWGG